MENEKIKQLKETFEKYAHSLTIQEKQVEVWFARELQGLLGYTQWRNFEKVVDKAKVSTENASEQVNDHFADVSKTIAMPKGASREIKDIMLTRYACYLIAQNGDPRKDEIAFAQNYFAVQTRKLEVIQERIKLQERIKARKKLTEQETKLSKNIFERGVDTMGFGRIRSKGDQAFFGGNSTSQMKVILGVPSKKPLADFLPTVTILGKSLATELTNINTERKNLHGEEAITGEHVTNNLSVRQLLLDRGVKPEDLPPEKDIKKLERQLKSGDKKALKEISRLSGNT